MTKLERNLQILIVEDNADDAKLIERALRSGAVAFVAQCVETRAAFVRALEENRPDVVLADYRLPHFDGLTAVRLAKDTAPDVPVIVVSGSLTDETAVQLLRDGAVDYVLKDRLSRLAPAVRRAVDEARERATARRAAKALSESEHRFRLLAAVAPVGILCIDANGQCTYVNDRWCEMTGMTAERAQRDGWLLGILPDDRARIARAWSRAAEAGSAFEAEYRLAGSGGAPVWAIGRAAPQKNDDQVSGYVVVVTDITERKHAEQAMKEQLDELRRFQEVTVDRELNMEELKTMVEQLEAEIALLRGTRDR